jgi:hypothetical protein
MQTVERPEFTAEEIAGFVWWRDSSLFQSKEKRDAVFECLKKNGHNVRKGTARNQRLHPEYVIDYVGTYETGFGNTDYDRHWKVLYRLEVVK